MKIKIIKYSQPQSWYKSRIGEIFNVLETDEKRKLYVVHKGRLLISYVDFDDCEILNEEIRVSDELVCDKGHSIRRHWCTFCELWDNCTFDDKQTN